MGRVVIPEHSLIKHKLHYLRDRQTTNKDFRELIAEITYLLTYEATADLKLEDSEVETPLGLAPTARLAGPVPVVVPILRAGLGMVEAILHVLPMAKVGHLGFYRDHDSLEPVAYYDRLPPGLSERTILVVDPMLATGGSAAAAIATVKKQGGQNIKFVCILAAPEGIHALQNAHADVEIFSAAVDERLNEVGYIVPGLGDAGDRIFGTL